MAKSLLAVVIVILVFGLVVLSSAGIVDGQKKFGSAYYYLIHQLLYGVLPGLLFMFGLSRTDYRRWKKLALPILAGALFLMVLVFVPSVGQGLKGATRWLNLGIFSFQPSEVLKLSLILYFAAWFGNRDERIRGWTYGMAPFFVVLGLAGGLLLYQPDVGTLIVVAGIILSMYFFGGTNLKRLGIIILVLIAVMAAAIYAEPYRFDRVKTFFDPSIDPRGISYQVNQSLIAIGSGGLFGVGYGNSTQKFGFLPEVVNDSIFSVIAEELGLIGASATIGLFLILAFFLTRIAKEAPDKFGRLVVMGMAVWITGQAFLNIAAVSGLVPLTGITLPFISYGGTAIASLLAGMGIVINIAKRT
ncbi:MAG: cell division protein FtsW [Candidatus Yanofskybacteria bacterium RIFCSPHIGHO2_02_FULL_44_12b]|uniref:Probable peptidoglycan glycosyltransferase FtsW n=2 Tax=Candidatus Yanofskyibacteriota TaxID=1752733 RepID=A0A1F8GQI2_9BACT|nr:MAG: Stage V sporulation protein E [Candidatus Yanofskybacteria bacterium GW2011_GWA2_44_9]OGN04692.1 MAG: cell division protein FtsW [Candidatus Yanofskybacteria bacterium RIFCSPHIGHO2_01_FULL_44_24]OGN15644.1 MAG: cell division protein FtsW [Candidatus Yanofskybacteria bacterium RIFCSPHIGHO2_02_FULL_44_12b]OGN26699.1 MAG: cell division protein FtsW [Candidatus Yanofskybacteria bacterium RIFCSPLOWO2_01_FULL_44_22]